MGFFFEEVDFDLFEILDFLSLDFAVGRVIDEKCVFFIGTEKAFGVVTDLG